MLMRNRFSSVRLLVLLVLTFAVLIPAAAQDNVELTLSIGARGFGDAAPVLIEACEEEVGGINVEWERISDVPNESRSIYVTNFTARNPKPDIIAVDVIWPGDFAARGWIAPVEDYIAEEDLADYLPGFLAAAQVGGSTYAIPLYIDGIHLFYRADLLDKYGLDVPTTWEELIAAAETVVEGEANPDLAGFISMWAKIEGLFMNWLAFFQGAGGTFFDADGNLAINNEAGIKSLSTMVGMLESGVAPESILTFRPNDARLLFQQERAVFLMVQDFVWATLTADDSPVKDAVALTRVPYFEGKEDTNTTVIGGFLLAVNANSENPGAAADFIKCFTSYESQVQAALIQGKVPTRPAVYDDERVVEGDPGIAALGANFVYAFARPSAQTGTAYPEISEIMQTEVSAALLGEKSPEQALADAEAQILAIMP
ncbi:MAG: ABC transporter substrate-binding protein [Chloroflexi bacterium]|nr:ABC transporter substrate-binding protein [Chloroflexota bacterium]